MLQLPKRLQSIDVFRAVTMFFMIFVNDVDGVTNIPEWIKHVNAHTDGLGFADTIFPSFLFIVGLSIPFALNKRMQSGENKFSIALHIILRSLALIIMGTFHVNLENYSEAAILPEAVFEIIITLAFFLIWLDYKPGINKIRQYVLQGLGIIILIVMAVLYKGEYHNTIVGMRPQWWGILGLIGWGYLTCALIYLITNGKIYWQVIALIFFLCFDVVAHVYEEDFSMVPKYIPLLMGNGSMAGFIMAGVVISLIYSINKQKDKSIFFTWLILLGIAFIAFGFITRPVAGISKIHDTPAWVGICTGIGVLVFAALIFLVDIKNKSKWFNIIKPAGTSTLTCYLLPYLLYSLMAVCNFNYPQFFNQGIGGIIRSFAIAFIVIFITGFLEKKKLRLKI
jgi:predicted acyltransferase